MLWTRCLRVPPRPKFTLEILTPNVTALEGRVFGK